ncbi:zinc finger protein 595 isoform X1 [Neodiprion lecontei]|uniref:Zinc finger protein 595 isoform X1 n=1 Tax=Neodiprion lecontei TaxID=441921 RepID=A0A6J0BP42_NEOLC|nr:zinc finger protein 595 isoform X1 [Neodiprion lecontei]
METPGNEQYVAFPLSTNMHETIISHEEICEPVVEDCVLPEVTVTEVVDGTGGTGSAEVEAAVEILTENSDDAEDGDGSAVYPIYIKQEEQQQQYTSGDDESMAVEALRQLGGMYPCFNNDKKIPCPNCAHLFTQVEMAKHHSTCVSVKLSCTTCGERFERKIDLNNHMVCHQVDRPHACRICGNLFRSKANLQSHMAQVHQTERPHKCNICNSNFQRPSSLSNHMKIHTYVAGRAIMQTSLTNNSVTQVTAEPFRKWPENNSNSETPATSVPSSSVSTIPNYEVSQVHWSIPSYNFSNDQPGVAGLTNQQDKMDTLQEFAVMPSGEVAQFEYTQQNTITNQINHQYNLSMNSFSSQDGSMVKIESLPYHGESRRSYVEVELTETTQQHTCSHCGMNFARASALAFHEKIHTSKNWTMPVECEYCDKQFQDSSCLATHQTTCAKKVMRNNTEHGLPSKWGKHACADCGKKFTTKQKMFRHQWIHRKKTHSCEVCGTQFEKQQELDEHRLSAHPGDSAFTCSECGKSFVSRQGLWEHARTHAGSPAHFHCDVCSKTFSSRQGYLIHHRTHTGERPYGCKFCWKAFRDGGTLRKHERIHTGERPHVCPLCSRAFNQKVVLREHVRWVHAAGKNETEVTGPPFRCPLCGALNQDRDELCAHIVKHSDQMIAQAKAKTNNNALKSKPAKKKSKTPASSGSSSSSLGKQITGSDRSISRMEQNEALLSISDVSTKTTDSLPQFMAVGKSSDTVLLITAAKRSEALRLISEVKPNDLHLISQGKQGENHLHIPQINHRETLGLNAEDKQGCSVRMASAERQTPSSTPRQNEGSGMHLMTSSKQGDGSVHLVSPNKQNNTLHLISKQNESLPVLTIPNPQNHDNFSSQIEQISNIDMPMNMVTHHSTSSSTTQHPGERVKAEVATSVDESLIQDGGAQSTSSHVQYQQHHQHRESDDGQESACGMCGEEFTNKNSLMEHVKIHI